MSLTEFTLFLSITFVVSASPGPVMLACMTNGGRYGITKSFEGMLGATVGNIFLLALSACGLGLIVATNNFLLNAIKWLGALYLVYLGIQMVRQPLSMTSFCQNKALKKSKELWLSSFFIAITNPKGFIYFGALLPQFIHYKQPLLWQFLLLTLTFLITDLIWMLVYSALGYRIMTWLKLPKHQMLFNSISGIVLIIAGLLIATTEKN